MASKAQPPNHSQRLLGVQLQHTQFGAVVAPCPQHSNKVLKIINDSLVSNQLCPDTAQRLAGKMVFHQTSLFGSVGRAALHPIYSRAANIDGRHHEELTHALRTALNALKSLLTSAKPKTVLFRGPSNTSVLYTDKFFQQGDKVVTPAHQPYLRQWSTTRCTNYVNGWGYVATIAGSTYFSHGIVPKYFLEIVAHLLAIIDLQAILPQHLVAFIDNSPGQTQTALIKGYGRDPAINNVLATYWAVISQLDLNIHLEWVCSANNISDAVSRHDVRQAHQLQWLPWQQDRTTFFQVLLKASSDIEHACNHAAGELLFSSFH